MLVRGGAANDALGPEARQRIHELEARQLELEMQNRTLREAQAALEESRAHYVELYDHAPAGQLTLDERGVIRELNLEAAALLDRDRPRLLGMPLFSVLAPWQERALDAHLGHCRAAEEPVTGELGISLPDGRTRFVEIVSAPRRSVGSGPRLFPSTLSPVDHARAKGLKGSAIDVVAHELRAPLGAMQLWLQALRLGGAGESLRARALDAIESCLKVELSIVEDLYALSRGRRELHLEPRPTSLHAAARAAVEAFAPVAAERSVTVKLADEVAPTPTMGDAARLQQVVANLLANATKFAPEGGHVTVSTRAVGANVILEVVDDGPGVAAGLLDAIFEPFRQYGLHGRSMEETPRTSEGLGLGLAIVRQIVEQHGGQVKASNEPGHRGFRMTVKLPRLAPPPRPRARSLREGRRSPPAL